MENRPDSEHYEILYRRWPAGFLHADSHLSWVQIPSLAPFFFFMYYYMFLVSYRIENIVFILGKVNNSQKLNNLNFKKINH